MNTAKYFVIAIMAILFQMNSVKAQKKVETVNIKTKIFCDHCKVCETCSSFLTETLYKLKGIKRVDVLENENTIQVAYNTQKINVEQIKQTIASCGYAADDIKADPNAYANLDGCCKKPE